MRDRVAVERALEAMFETDEQLQWTFVHGDPHLGNTFVEPDGRPGFVDWQGVARGPYIWDVTYFLTGALDTEVRRVNEQDLLRDYLGRLAASGVDAPSFNDAWLAHRRHMMHGYLSILTPDQMQPDSFATIMGGRFARAADDLETLSAFH
jgi:aminoglycoside/choline kinase family phosphotransferase